MPKVRKTIDALPLLQWLNANTAGPYSNNHSRDERKAMCAVAEHVLHELNAYAGFRETFLDPSERAETVCDGPYRHNYYLAKLMER